MTATATLGLAALALAIVAAPAPAASISDTLKKFNGKKDQTVKKAEDGEVIATKGDWTLIYDHAWNSIAKSKLPICSMKTRTVAVGEEKQSSVFYTRWANKPDFAEFAINWGPNLSDGPANLVFSDGHKELLYLSQGVGFLNDLVDADVAKAYANGGKASLSFEMKASGQVKREERQFSLAGFGEIYELLFSGCEPVEDFHTKQ